jgi:hypothetical protein
MKTRKTRIRARAKTDIITREQRRKQVAQYLQQSLTETEIAARLNVCLSVVYRDIQALKQTANQFVYDLAKSDLAYFYKDLLDDINKARLNVWAIYYNRSDSEKREKLLALKTVIASNTEMFNLLSQGPTVMAVKSLNERINAIKLAQSQGQGQQQQQGRTPIV